MEKIEYAAQGIRTSTELKKFTKEWIEARIAEQKTKSELTPDELKNIELKEKQLDKKLDNYYRYYNDIIKSLQK